MVIDKMIEAAVSEFKQNLLFFCGEFAEGALTPESAEAVTKGIQASLAQTGKAAFKAFLEEKEEPGDIIAFDGEALRFKQFSNKVFISLWGKMSVARKLFQNAADTRSHCPMDEAWGMAGQFVALEVREAVGYACAHMTAEEAAVLFKKTAMFDPHPTIMKRVLKQMEQQLAPHREAVDRRIREQEEIPEGTRVLVASMDGVNVPLNEKDGKQDRPAERANGGGGKEKATVYRNATVGSVSFYGEVPEGKKCPERLLSRYVSHMPEAGAPAFKEKFEAELAAAMTRFGTDVKKVLLCDGARPIWNYAEGTELFGDFEMLIDYWHAAEHLSQAADALFGKGTEEAKAWYEKYVKKLKEEDNGARRVLQSMDYHAQTRRLSLGQMAALAEQRTYFTRNKGKMNYADFRRRGLPIGSGPVEAACKTVVKARLCRSGMRWSCEGGQRILDLRTYVKSGRWDAYWSQYKEVAVAV